ncbi:MAG: hypothetical protein AAF206_09090 [Bacteroidota bacterium]
MKPLGFSCPHCYTEQQRPLQQRCQVCSLNMMSDQAFGSWQKVIAPRAQEIEQLFAAKKYRAIQPLLTELAPYDPHFSSLQKWREACQQELPAPTRFSPQLIINCLIWLVLIMAPVFALMSGADLMMTGFLTLPVLGWAYLGIWPLVRK